ncbi:hypothetical protein IscW_ISCW000877 [Ixodes scapularis]|uniref:Uncharacterized protein n=1 Tax=Ixodes scapularis TaxID=6945 RepID=B7P1D7_IXOSC|nr:hypothetical protein IscW_ISCW000877 [Ixodes scapularis]|eukprot:XP_002433345.1 hypothetical protein IscW_ISCW000877 [Ixodes scapularis]
MPDPEGGRARPLFRRATLSAGACSAPVPCFPQHSQSSAFGFYKPLPLSGHQYLGASRGVALPCFPVSEAYDALSANYLHFYRPVLHSADLKALMSVSPKPSHS